MSPSGARATADADAGAVAPKLVRTTPPVPELVVMVPVGVVEHRGDVVLEGRVKERPSHQDLATGREGDGRREGSRKVAEVGGHGAARAEGAVEAAVGVVAGQGEVLAEAA